jgi:hypothetical protein
VSFLGRVAVKGLRRGLAEGSRGWLVVGASATVLAALRRVLHEQETVYRAELKPGEGMQVRVTKPKR